MTKDASESTDGYKTLDTNKWAKASVKTTQLKFLLDDILNKNFSEEEKQSKRYIELMETVDMLFGHVLEPYHIEREIRQKEQLVLKENELNILRKKTSIFSLRSAIIAGVGVGVLKTMEFLFSLIFSWLSSGGPSL